MPTVDESIVDRHDVHFWGNGITSCGKFLGEVLSVSNQWGDITCKACIKAHKRLKKAEKQAAQASRAHSADYAVLREILRKALIEQDSLTYHASGGERESQTLLEETLYEITLWHQGRWPES